MEKMICGDKGEEEDGEIHVEKGVLLMTKATIKDCLLYTSPSPRDGATSRMPSSA